METDELIRCMADDLKPVAKPFSARRAALKIFFAGICFLVAALFGVVGWERLGSFDVSSGPLWTEIGGACALACLAGGAALLSSIPGRTSGIAFALSAVVVLAASMALLALVPWSSGLGTDLGGRECAKAAIGLGIPPAVLLFPVIRRLAPTRPWLSGLMVGLSAFGLGWLMIALICSNHHARHVLTWHLALPALALGAFTAVAAQVKIRW